VGPTQPALQTIGFRDHEDEDIGKEEDIAGPSSDGVILGSDDGEVILGERYY